jgi:hypothetical protein
MGQFFRSHKLLKLSQDKIDNLNISITTKDIGFVIKMLLHKKETFRPKWLCWRILSKHSKRNI